MHNAVRAGIKSVFAEMDEDNPSCILSKVKGFVSHIRRSPKQAEVFKACQQKVLDEGSIDYSADLVSAEHLVACELLPL